MFLTLVTGFLGSGKTTLLRHWADADTSADTVFLVNEFAEADVDSQLLASPGREVLSVAGGSIFCDCKIGDFLTHMRALAFRPDGQRPRQLIVEASGMADPVAAAKVLRDSKLDSQIHISSIVTVIAPASFLKLTGRIPAIDSQVHCSDHIILNKTDLATADEVAACEARLRSLNSSAALTRTRHCLDVPPPRESIGNPHAADAGRLTARSSPWFRTEVPLHAPLDAEALASLLRASGDLLFRAKGFVPTSDGSVLVDHTPEATSIADAASAPEEHTLVLIGEELRRRHILDLAREIRNLPPS